MTYKIRTSRSKIKTWHGSKSSYKMNNRNTVVYIRVKGSRPPGFVDPPEFEWNKNKEKQLWSRISSYDTTRQQIDWHILSESLEAPIYFLKKRSYTLFANNLQKLSHFMDTDNSNLRLKSNDILDYNDLSKSPIHYNSNRINSFELETSTKQNVTAADINPNTATEINEEQTAENTIKKLQTSKIMAQDAPLGFRNKNNKDDIQERSNEDISSSLSISTSALEEALMDRLQISSNHSKTVELA